MRLAPIPASVLTFAVILPRLCHPRNIDPLRRTGGDYDLGSAGQNLSLSEGPERERVPPLSPLSASSLSSFARNSALLYRS